MPSGFRDDDEDDLFEHVAAMADRMGLEGEKRENYIDDHMIQGGYARVQTRESYARVQENADEDAEGERPRRSWFSDSGDRDRDRDRGRGGRRPPIRSQQRGAEDDRY